MSEQREPVSELQSLVDEALNNAEANGYFDDGQPLAKMMIEGDYNGLATDLIEYDTDFGSYDYESEPQPLLEAIKNWCDRFNTRYSQARGEFF